MPAQTDSTSLAVTAVDPNAIAQIKTQIDLTDRAQITSFGDYPQPTVFSAHPLIVVNAAAEPLVDALMSPDLQAIAWTRHGFRGPLGLSGETGNPLVASRIMPRVDAVLPMPDIKTMLALIARIAG